MSYLLILLVFIIALLIYLYHSLLVRYAVAQEKLRNQEAVQDSLRSFSLNSFKQVREGELYQQSLEEKHKAISQTVEQLLLHIRLSENERKSEHGAIKQQLQTLIENEDKLRVETSKLSKAFHSPSTAGRWGEIQLKRVVELAGMLSYADFSQQLQCNKEGHRCRPDLVVKLPGGHQIIVDAKVSLDAYLEGVDSLDEEFRMKKFQLHSRHIKEQITRLGKKRYSEYVDFSAGFVILFLPSEAIFRVAIENDPSLMEYSVTHSIILATPMTLIALLRTIAYGWKQENLSQSAQQICKIGSTLCLQIAQLSSDWEQLGTTLSRGVDLYNKTKNKLQRGILLSAEELDSLQKRPSQIGQDQWGDASSTERTK